ncbi:MAG: ABC transporter ATP-binding protein [Lentisphaerae bacterium]|nr:ABC transporter ATP-binding protein [Lentisphaerota bacterium]
MNNTVVQVDNVSKIYRLYGKHTDRLKESLHPLRRKYHQEFFALRNVSLSIKTGETMGIIGRNGSGKSTLLKMITGILTPTSGKITVNGKISALLELGTGFNPELTGRENVFFTGAIMGFSPDEIKEKLENILTFADIGVFIDQPVKMYSSGMFVRLAFAVAISVDPDILIIDEALAVGDFGFQAKCYRKFLDFKESGKTIIFVTHSLDTVIRYCDKVMVLEDGLKLREADPKQAVDVYKKLIVDCLDDNPAEDNSEKNKAQIESASTVNKNGLSYGNGSATILAADIIDESGLCTGKLFNGSEYTIRMKVKFLSDVSDPIFAFTIKDLKGMEITGTNTWFQMTETGKKTKGDMLEVCFKQKLNLQPGGYALSLGCTGFEDDNFVVYHRLYDILLFEAIGDTEFVGFYNPNSEIQIAQTTSD